GASPERVTREWTSVYSKSTDAVSSSAAAGTVHSGPPTKPRVVAPKRIMKSKAPDLLVDCMVARKHQPLIRSKSARGGSCGTAECRVCSFELECSCVSNERSFTFIFLVSALEKRLNEDHD